LEGHPELGLRVLGDLYRTGNFGVMERTALLLQDLRQPNQALAIAWAAHQSAPHLAAGRALLAELLWRQSRYGEAAKALADGRLELSTADWRREIAPRFVAWFGSGEHDALAAAQALAQAGLSDRATIGTIPEALADAGDNAIAFELQSRLPL